MRRRPIRSILLALSLCAAAGCTIDIPQSYYQDSTSTPPTDTGAADSAQDTGAPVDVPLADTGQDTGAPLDVADVADVPDGTAPDALPDDTGTGDAAADADAAPADIVVGDVAFPPSCELDEECVPQQGELPDCVVGKCIEGACKPGAAPDGTTCDDPALVPTACIVEQCKAAKCRLVELGEAAPCGVTDMCFEDRCNAAGLCVAVAVAECDDGNDCTVDSCDPDTGCKNESKVGTPCDDDNLCTEIDKCGTDGTCAGTPIECTAPTCFKSTCDPETGKCVEAPATGDPCDDGDPCTSFDKCTTAGVCAGSFKCPKPANPCHKATCSAQGVCGTAPAQGQACNDGNGCTVPDVCECPSPTFCTLTEIKCVGKVVPFGRTCETAKDCAYAGSSCLKGVCVIECGISKDCPQPLTNQGTAVCEPFGGAFPTTNVCRIEKCPLPKGQYGSCIDGSCFP